jgi:hypothetical protein
MNANCHKEFSRTTIYKYLGAEYVNTKYKYIREHMLYDIEKRLLQTTQLLLDKESRIKKLQEEASNLSSLKFLERLDLKDEIFRLESSTDMRPICDTISIYNNTLDNLNNLDLKYHEMRMVLLKEIDDIKNDNIKITRTYTRQCPNFECKAMLSLESISKYDNFLCSLCRMIYCKKCNEYIKDEAAEVVHKCNDDIIKNLEQINIDSKSCPSCGIIIYKSEGCFEKNTIIPLFDGTNKLASEIIENDILIGDDGLPRTVINIVNGKDDLYKIEQSNGIYYIVNSNHKLCLLSKSNIDVKMTVMDFIGLPDNYKCNLMGYKVLNDKTIKSTLTVTKCKYDDFYGFEVNDNHKFLLMDNTVVSNCDQMYCTHCHSPFSWKSLKIISNEHFHNPHYNEYIRNQKGFNNRDPLDIICGREINDNIMDKLSANFEILKEQISSNTNISKKIRKEQLKKVKQMELDTILKFAKIVIHLRRYVIPSYRINNKFASNNKYRIAFLKNEISLNHFKIKIQRSDKANQKKQEILDVITMFNTCTIDIIYRLVYEDINFKFYESTVMELHKLEKYSNKCLDRISKVFNHTYKPICQL